MSGRSVSCSQPASRPRVVCVTASQTLSRDVNTVGGQETSVCKILHKIRRMTDTQRGGILKLLTVNFVI